MSTRKPDGERSNRKPYVYPTTYLVRDGEIRGPEPKPEWPAETKAFWTWLRQSAQAQQMQESDWLYLQVAMKIHAQMWTDKAMHDQKTGEILFAPCSPAELRGLAAEFRTYFEAYGITHQSRVKYGINILEEGDAITEAKSVVAQATTTKVDYRAEYADLED